MYTMYLQLVNMLRLYGYPLAKATAKIMYWYADMENTAMFS